MRLAFKWLSLGLLALILILSSLLFWLLSSQSGLRWAVTRAPSILQVESINGDINDLSFKQLNLSLAGTTVSVADGALRWRLSDLLNKQVTVNTLSLNEVRVKLASSEPSDVPFEPWQGLELPIDINLANASVTQLVIDDPKQPIVLGNITLVAKLESNVLNLQELAVSDADNSLALSGKVDLSAQASGVVEIKHSLDWQFGDNKVVSDGLISGTWSSVKIVHNQLSPVAAELAATVDDSLTHTIKWTTNITTDPLDNEALLGQVVSAESGIISSQGQFEPARGFAGLQAAVKAQLTAGTAEFSQWQVDANVAIKGSTLNLEQFELLQVKQDQPARLKASGVIENVDRFFAESDDQSKIDLKGNWSSLTWPLQATTANERSEQLDSNGQFSVSGVSNQYSVLADITGRAYQQPLTANADVLLVGRAIDIRNLELASGSSLLTAKGQIDENIDLSWNLQSPDLGDFFLDGSGAITSKGRVSGTVAEPIVNLEAISKAVSVFGYSAENLNVTADVSLVNVTDPLSVKVQASSLSQNQNSLADNFDLALTGRLESHTLVIDSTLANKATLAIKTDGVFDKTQWNGVVSALTFDDPKLDVWALQDAVELRLAAGDFSLSQMCLTNQSQAICLDAEQNNDTLKANAKLAALDLANVNRLSELYDIKVAGQIDGELTYSKAPQHASLIDGYIESTSTMLTLVNAGDDELDDQTLEFDLVRVKIKQVDNLQGSAEINLANADKITLDFAVASPIEEADFMQAELQAKAGVAIADLSVLPTALLESIALNGALRADMTLAGSIEAPEIIASAKVSDAWLEIEEFGLELEDITLNVDSKGTSKVDIDGQLKSGEGILKIDGGVDFADLKAPLLELSLNGDALQLANSQTLNVVGDIALDVSFTEQLLDLKGAVTIAEADLDFKLSESAVLVSDDVVLEGVEPAESPVKQRLNMSIDLGKNTHISAQGLDADLLGKLVVFQEPDGILRGEGEINVNDGRYRAYGQDLKIDKGRLIFDGGTIDDPSLSLSAEKTIESTTAGVSVSGRASSPRLNLYSTPSMPDQDILSVLVFNKPVGDLGSQDGLALLRIANSLRGDGTSGVTKVTKKLQQTLGLTNLELQTTDNAPSIVAGKQLSSKLYVGYGYGLLDAAQSLILRYNLNKAWSVKADFGADSGADLRYQIER